MRSTFINQLLASAKEDKSILLITGDLGYGVVDQFAAELPNQFLNFGINEQSMMGAAAGFASKGFKPFVYSIGNFPTFRCLEQIRNDVCHMNLDVCIVALGAGFSYGTAGYSHHLVEDISALSALPNVSIYSPADTREVELLYPNILAKGGPRYLRLGKGGEGRITEKFQQVASGISVLSGSNKLAVITTGHILSEVIFALKEIPPELHPTVISVSDFDSIKDYVAELRFDRVLTIEEHVLRGGFGSIVLEYLSNLNCNIKRIGIDRLSSKIIGSQQFLRRSYGLDSVAMAKLFNQEMTAGKCYTT